MTADPPTPRRRVVLVTGLSGAASFRCCGRWRTLASRRSTTRRWRCWTRWSRRSERKLAIGVDARTRGFDAARVLETLARLRANPALRPELVYAWADEATLLRRYTETRRRHPLAPHGRVVDRHRRASRR